MSKCKMRFCTYNYAEEDSDITFSSEHTTYVAANARNEIRSKIWKPAGYFLIDSGNNSMKIGDGADKYATIASGEYTGTTLAAAIQTALNAVSTLWAVTYSTTTYKFNITRSSSGTLYLTDTTNATWDTIGYTRSENITSTTFIADEQRNHSFEYYQIDNGTPLVVSFIGAICPIDEVFNLSGDAEVRFQGNDIDDFSNPPLDVELEFNERGIYKFFDQDVTDTEYRYHRLKIIDRMNHDGPGALSVSLVYIGDTDTIESSNVSKGLDRTPNDQSIEMTSESGQKYFDERPTYETFSSMRINAIAAEDRIKIEQIFADGGKRVPFFVSLDPFLNLESDPALYTKYVRFAQKPVFNHAFMTYYDVNFQFDEVI